MKLLWLSLEAFAVVYAEINSTLFSSATARSTGTSPGSGSVSGSYLGTSAPFPKFDHPSHALLRENGFKQLQYNKFYARCVKDRATKGDSS